MGRKVTCAECDKRVWSGESVTCRHCSKTLCRSHSYQWTDGSNAAISKHAPILCLDCYNVAYPKDRQCRHDWRPTPGDGYGYQCTQCKTYFDRNQIGPRGFQFTPKVDANVVVIQ